MNVVYYIAMTFRYKKAVVGGTFDHFHQGHQKLLDAAFEESTEVAIGLTTAHMYEH
ncbi:MAG TPA: adenylyltransferase/cytidyltransferase family protein, partial [Patescibacteria group bacterium]